MQSFFRRAVPVIGAVAVTFALIAPLAGAAQDDSNDSVATEGTGVARIGLIDGNVAVQRGDSADSLAAVPNTPLLGGDYVTTGDASRSEIQIDGYAAVRLDQDAQIRFTHLDPGNRSVQLAAGTLELHLANGDGSSEIDTPSVSIQPRQSGSYRVSVTPAGATLVTVRAGDATIITPQSRQDLLPGSTVVADGDPANPEIRIEAAVAPDDFDRFNRDRDRALAAVRADAAFVNPQIGGLEDLAADGRWVFDGSYGNVWVPAAVGPDWAPYRDGRWVWEDGFGWTWLAAEPWGWAPYHYGSWYNSPTYGWCWYPPQPHVVVPWRPALVAFIGFGAGAGFALGFAGGNAFGQIGWVPLAPSEPYHPWWGDRYGAAGPTIVNTTNVTNVTNVTNINVYRNVQYNAVSSVSSQSFLQGNFNHNVAVTAPQLREARVFRGAIPVVPTASNLRFSGAAVPAIAVRPELHAGAFAGKPAVVHRTPFGAQRVAFATAAHTAITPLHFKDAATTPLEPAVNPGVGRMPAHSAGLPDATASTRRYTTAHPTENAAARETGAGGTGFRHVPADKIEDQTPSAITHEGAPIPNNRAYAPAAAYHQPAGTAAYRAPRTIPPMPHEARAPKAEAAHAAPPNVNHPARNPKPHAKPSERENHHQ
jgi:hypothetical protein